MFTTSGFSVEMAALEMVTSCPLTATVAVADPAPSRVVLPATGTPNATGKVILMVVTFPPLALARTWKLRV